MFGFPSKQQIAKRWNYPQVNTATADDAYKWVKDNVGSSLSRDSVDARIIQQMTKNSGAIIDSQEDVGGLPKIASNQGPRDSDKDGMPDTWEDKQNLNKDNAKDRNNYTLDSRYTNLEVYLNSLVNYGS